MSGCCDDGCSLDRLRERQRGTLQVVLGINAVMFFVIVVAALFGRSTALLADSLDNFGDALTYALSLYAVSRGTAVKAKVAIFKGGLILFAAVAVAVQLVYKLFVPSLPIFEVMGAFSLLGLATNSLCLFLLWRHRHEDVNMSSVWECSRNDIASNLAVFMAAGAVWATDNLLLISISPLSSCLHVIDGSLPVYSASEALLTRQVGQYSRIDRIIPSGTSPVPPVSIFKSEPKHDWCYYYQKASLARQKGDWEEIGRLYEQVNKLKLNTDDKSELIPFLEGLVNLGNYEDARILYKRNIRGSAETRLSVCSALGRGSGISWRVWL